MHQRKHTRRLCGNLCLMFTGRIATGPFALRLVALLLAALLLHGPFAQPATGHMYKPQSLRFRDPILRFRDPYVFGLRRQIANEKNLANGVRVYLYTVSPLRLWDLVQSTNVSLWTGHDRHSTNETFVFPCGLVMTVIPRMKHSCFLVDWS